MMDLFTGMSPQEAFAWGALFGGFIIACFAWLEIFR